MQPVSETLNGYATKPDGGRAAAALEVPLHRQSAGTHPNLPLTFTLVLTKVW